MVSTWLIWPWQGPKHSWMCPHTPKKSVHRIGSTKSNQQISIVLYNNVDFILYHLKHFRIPGSCLPPSSSLFPKSRAQTLQEASILQHFNTFFRQAFSPIFPLKSFNTIKVCDELRFVKVKLLFNIWQTTWCTLPYPLTPYRLWQEGILSILGTSCIVLSLYSWVFSNNWVMVCFF